MNKTIQTSIFLWILAAPLAALDITKVGEVLNGWPVVMAWIFVLLGFVNALLIINDNY